MTGEPHQADRHGAEHEPGTLPLRPVAIVVAVLLICAVGYLAHSCAGSGGGSTFTDQVSHYRPDSVTYLASARTYLVRHPDGSFLALSEVEQNREDRVAGCVIRYRADLSAAGDTGVFRDDCHGTLFRREGDPVQGTEPTMQRHPVATDGKSVSVRFRSCIGGASQSQIEPCRE